MFLSEHTDPLRVQTIITLAGEHSQSWGSRLWRMWELYLLQKWDLFSQRTVPVAIHTLKLQWWMCWHKHPLLLPCSKAPPDPHLSGFTHRGSQTAANNIKCCEKHVAVGKTGWQFWRIIRGRTMNDLGGTKMQLEACVPLVARSRNTKQDLGTEILLDLLNSDNGAAAPAFWNFYAVDV